MAQLTEELAGKIIIRQTIPTGMRLFFGALSLFPLLAPYELLYKPRWRFEQMDMLGLAIALFFVLLALAPLTLTVMLLSASIFGQEESFTFDAYKQRLFYKAAPRPWHTAVQAEIDYSELQPDKAHELKVEEHENSEGPNDFILTLVLPGGKKATIAHYAGRQAAEAMREKLLRKA